MTLEFTRHRPVFYEIFEIFGVNPLHKVEAVTVQAQFGGEPVSPNLEVFAHRQGLPEPVVKGVVVPEAVGLELKVAAELVVRIKVGSVSRIVGTVRIEKLHASRCGAGIGHISWLPGDLAGTR